MAKQPIFDEQFKQNVNDKYQAVKDKVSDAILNEEGKLDTDKLESKVTETAQKVEQNVKAGYQKFSDAYIKDGSLDTEKLGQSARTTYRKAGRVLATGVGRLAKALSDKFGVMDQNAEIIDSELVREEDFDR